MKDERAAEGLDHLQTAALELIHAARAFLDVAEDLVADPDKVAEVVSALGTMADVATRAAKSRGDHAADAARGSGSSTGSSKGRGDRDDGVQHIKVSS